MFIEVETKFFDSSLSILSHTRISSTAAKNGETKNGAAASRCCSNWRAKQRSAKLRTFDSGPLIPRRCWGKRVKSVQRLDQLIKRNVHGLTSWPSVRNRGIFLSTPFHGSVLSAFSHPRPFSASFIHLLRSSSATAK